MKQPTTEVVKLYTDKEGKALEIQFIHDRSSGSIDRSSRSKFESLILHVQIKDPMTEIKSEWLDQIHLILQRL